MNVNLDRRGAQAAAATRAPTSAPRRNDISAKQLRQVWNEADTIPGRSPEKWRRDRLGNILRKGSFGTLGRFGWTVDYALQLAGTGQVNPPPLEAIHAAARRCDEPPVKPRPPAARPPAAARVRANPKVFAWAFPAPGTVLRSDVYSS